MVRKSEIRLEYYVCMKFTLPDKPHELYLKGVCLPCRAPRFFVEVNVLDLMTTGWPMGSTCHPVS